MSLINVGRIARRELRVDVRERRADADPARQLTEAVLEMSSRAVRTDPGHPAGVDAGGMQATDLHAAVRDRSE